MAAKASSMLRVRATGAAAPAAAAVPLLRAQLSYVCTFAAFGTMETEYTIHFNSYANKKSDQADRAEGEEAEGPIVNRQCPKCGNDQMSYATLQLRSADEGQTVFFTCTKCK